MNSIDPSTGNRGDTARLEARLAVQWAECRRLAEALAAIEGSAAWGVARRLSRWRQRIAPAGSWRHKVLSVCLRRIPRESVGAVASQLAAKFRRSSLDGKAEIASPPTATPQPEGDRTAAASEGAFRVVFIGPGAACEAQSMRYRVHNVIAALALAGHDALFVPLEQVQANLASILSYDVIVLVRLMSNTITTTLIEAARRHGLPIVYDIDDYLFDPWVMPYVEAFRMLHQADALGILDEIGACLDGCDYFTGSTAYLAEKATARGKKSFVIHNGLNVAQLRLAQAALEQRAARPCDGKIRMGYFSGTRTHQADFRVVYPALMRLLAGDANVRLVIVGDLDLGDFPGLTPFLDQIDLLPLRPWSELPATMASIDVNLIPLELTPFNEGKSNLKYFEAGLLKVPSIASPTRINGENVLHGHNGFLAQTAEEWFTCMRELAANALRREQMGQRAFEYVLRTYAPLATATEALEVYRQIRRLHQTRSTPAGPSTQAA